VRVVRRVVRRVMIVGDGDGSRKTVMRVFESDCTLLYELAESALESRTQILRVAGFEPI